MTFSVLNEDKLILVKDLHPLNIPDIFSTFDVLNDDNFIFFKE
jgi:hypothetical protein